MEKIKNFFRKLKPNRAVYITAITLIVALGVIIAITVATNRAKKKGDEKPPVDSGTDSNVTTQAPEDTNTPETDAPTPPPADTDTPKVDAPTPEDTKTEDVADALPSLTLPVSGNLSSKHDESLQVWSETMRDWRVHLGVDIATEANAPVYAAADGVVSQIWEDVKMGYCISIKHDGDAYTVYRNLGKEPAEGIEVGVEVRAGQLIGSVGSSAMVEVADDPHLHLEMTIAGKQVNPLDYFDEASIASLNIGGNIYED